MKKYFLWALCGIGLMPAMAQKPTASRPNIIFIMSDDHALQSISAYGSPYIQTPNIDRIAKEGALFQNSFCGNSICAPSRATILTGKHTNVNGQIHNGVRFDSSQQTFPKMLQAAGYRTAMIGKWHLKSQPTGFNYWMTMPDQGSYYNPDFIFMDGTTRREEGYATNLITDHALQWLDSSSKSGQPFCLLLYNKAPHRNWMPDTADFDLYRNVKYPLPANFYDDYIGRIAAQEQEMSISNDMFVAYDLKMYDPEIKDTKWSLTNYQHDYERLNPAQKAAWDKEYGPIIEDFKKKNLSGTALTEWKYQRYMEDYLRCIASVDRNVGRVLAFLDEHHLAENTIIVYTSDQGMYLGEHGWFDKRFMYEQSLHMPFMMRYPKIIKPGTKINQLVQNIDYAPTLLEMVGIPVDTAMQGISFKPLVEGKKVKWRDAIYYHYYEFPAFHQVKRHYGIRTDRFKLIHFYNNIDSWELYDLKKDPDEMHNLVNDPGSARLLQKMKQRLAELRVQYRDLKEDNFVRPF